MSILILFLIVPLLAIGLALAFYSKRLGIKRGAWFFLVFFTLLCGSLRWWVGFAVPVLAFAFLLYLLSSEDGDSETQSSLGAKLWACLRI